MADAQIKDAVMKPLRARPRRSVRRSVRSMQKDRAGALLLGHEAQGYQPVLERFKLGETAELLHLAGAVGPEFLFLDASVVLAPERLQRWLGTRWLESMLCAHACARSVCI